MDPYPPIGDYGLIGDCHSAALISREGAIDWCCLPRFDSGSAFGRLLDWEHGGHCQVAPTGSGWEATRDYLEDTLVLETSFRTRGGEARLLDSFLAAERPERSRGPTLLRVIEGQRGTVELEVKIAPRFDYGQITPWIR